MFWIRLLKNSFILLSFSILLVSCSTIPGRGQNDSGLLILAIEKDSNYTFPQTKWKLSVIDVLSNVPVYTVTTPVVDKTFVIQLPPGEYYIQNQDIHYGKTSVENVAFYRQVVVSGNIHLYPFKFYIDAEKKESSVVYNSRGWVSITSDEERIIEETLMKNENFTLWRWVGLGE